MLPRWHSGKESTHLGSLPGWGRSCKSQFLGRLIRNLGSPRRKEGSGALKEKIGSGILKEEERINVFFFLFLSLSHIKFFLFKPGTDDYTTKQLSLKSVLRII